MPKPITCDADRGHSGAGRKRALAAMWRCPSCARKQINRGVLTEIGRIRKCRYCKCEIRAGHGEEPR